MTLSAALASLHARLQSDAADGVRRLRASPAYGDVGKLQELAVAGTTQAVPGLALAALLRAAELEPTIATHLIDAAAIATSVGMPNEAIALLDAAAQRTYRKPALGIPVQTIAAVVRGQALVMTGRLAEARPWFVAARHAAPVLTEADAGLATVEACSGRTAVAGRFVESSRVRTHTETPQGQDPVEIDPTTHVDLTKGRPTPLRNLPIGQTPTTLVGLRQTYLDVLNDTTGEVGRHQARVDAATARLEAADANSSVAERLRRSSLVHLGQSTTNGRAEAIEAEIEQVKDRLRTISEEFWDEANDFHGPGVFPTIREDAVAACAGSQDRDCAEDFIVGQCRPALVDAHGRWRSAMGRLDTLSAEHLDIVSRLRSSIAANLDEPSAHELVLLGIAALERQHYDQLAHEALLWASAAATFADLCVEPAPGTPEPTEDAPDVESQDPCTPGVAAIAFKTKLGPAEIKINCEKIQQELSAEVLPFLSAFGEVSYDFRAGAITVVVGAKTKVGGGPLEGSFKSGAYVKVGQDGVQDVGWQVGPEVTSTAGKIELTTYKDEMDISFVSGLSTGF
ncbi:hypothetical protein [Nocardioides sp.]|uniref:hypothetical protein n=1 Tax=Nocardioides sp. TaxID=35761 RepID=UPI002719A679|nr:hypothetical protein [Nocardioides sp.]MDO9455974.1 hypothetical protein [Nocardioides sp.]